MCSCLNLLLPLIEVRSVKGTCLIHTSNILYVEAKNKHSMLFLDDSSQVEICQTLKGLQKLLPEPEFFRCHHSFIVNCLCVKSIMGYNLVLDDKMYVPLSRSKKQSCINNLVILKHKIVTQTLPKTANYAHFSQSGQ